MNPENAQTTALFLDFENTGVSDAARMLQVIRQLEPYGRVIVRRVYGDWETGKRSATALLRAGFELVQAPSYVSRKKNSTDIRIVIDALELALTRPDIGTFAIAAHDSDYIPLCARLREVNKRVIAIGNPNDACNLLQAFCDKFISLEAPTAEANPISNGGKTPGTSNGGGAKPIAAGVKQAVHDILQNQSKPMRKALLLLLQSLEIAENKGFVADACRLKTEMLRIDSTFHENKLGFTRFRAFLDAAHKAGVVNVDKTTKSRWRITHVAIGGPPTAGNADDEQAPLSVAGDEVDGQQPVVWADDRSEFEFDDGDVPF